MDDCYFFFYNTTIQYISNKYRNNENIQGNINRSMISSENNEELVPMITATQFDDDESEGN